MKLMRRLLHELHPFNEDSLSIFLVALIDKKRDVSYINQYVVVAHYWGECFNIPGLQNYPLYKARDRDDYVASPMSDDEIEAFLSVQNPHPKHTFYWKRFEMWTVFWSICAYHACRMGECATMRKTPLKDSQSCVDFGANIVVFDGKTGPRRVPLSFIVRDKLRWYVDNLVDGEYLFPSKHAFSKTPYVGDVAWGQDFWKRIEKIESQFPGLSTRLNLKPYSLRHSAGTRWAEENWSLPKIQSAMGHKRLDTTQKYLHMSLKGVAEMIDNDRLSFRHKKGIELVDSFIDEVRVKEKRYSGKVFFNVRKQDKHGRKYRIDIEVID